MSEPRVQFTILRMMLATLWMGACFGALAFMRRHPSADSVPDGVKVLLLFLALGGPFISAAALFGRIWAGIGAAIIFVACAIFVLSR
jgi:hypothetical protein